MSPDFRLFSESESRNEALVRPALARGQVLVVTGPRNDVRGVIGPWCGFVTVRPGERIGEVQRALHRSGARVALVIGFS